MKVYASHDRSFRARSNRLKRWTWQMLLAWDQWLHVLLGGPKYIWRGGPVPNCDETISSKVGRQALKGKRWAIVCGTMINWVAARLGEEDHCRLSIEWDEIPVLTLEEQSRQP